MACLPRTPAQVGEQFAFDAVLGSGVDLVDQGDKQLDEGVGDLAHRRTEYPSDLATHPAEVRLPYASCQRGAPLD